MWTGFETWNIKNYRSFRRRGAAKVDRKRVLGKVLLAEKREDNE